MSNLQKQRTNLWTNEKWFKIAVILDSTVNTERTEIERLNIFSYILINKDASYYDDIMKNKKILRNIIEI